MFYKLHGKSSLIQGQVQDIIKGLLKNYGKDEFIHLFVYPYFEKNTLLNLKSNIILEFLLNYLTEIAYKAVTILFDIVVVEKENDNNKNIFLIRDTNVQKRKIRLGLFLHI